METKRFICVVLTGICLLGYIFLQENSKLTEAASLNNSYHKVVAITFDDGPNPGTTWRLLEGLKERGVKATFFLVGERIEDNEDIVLRMYNDGHVIGNHTYSHVELTKIPEREALEEISVTNGIIEEITGEEVAYIRPPCGLWDEKMLFQIDMTPVFWDVDPKDWCTLCVNDVVERVIRRVDDGDIILFHD
ncbi:MAG: polysaccharide deacetylase family protein, partial [Butyrivibrio sp.]